MKWYRVFFVLPLLMTIERIEAQPSILEHPQNVAVTLGGDAEFAVVAQGQGLTFQWRFNGAAISSATNMTLSLTNVALNQFGRYAVVVGDSAGAASISDPAWLRLGRWTELVNFGASWSIPRCDGGSWPEYLAMHLGAQLLSYAEGGAFRRREILSQITKYFSGHTSSETTLAMLWGQPVAEVVNLGESVEAATDHTIANLRTLAERGIRGFLVPTEIPGTVLPGAINSPVTEEVLMEIDRTMNTKLGALQDEFGLTIYRPDMSDFFFAIWRDPSAYGFPEPHFFDPPGSGFEWPEVFCDGIHFTHALVRIIASEFFLTVTERPKLETQWVRIPTDPASTPAGRESAAMVYDEQRERIVMHGGIQRQGLPSTERPLNDTWEWDGKTWTLVSTSGPKVLLHNMAYDAFRGVTVLYGGRWLAGADTNYMNANETWEWNGESWKPIDTGAADPLVLAGLVYDPNRKKVLRHGGIFNGDLVHQDPATYEWDGTNWTAIAEGSFKRAGQSVTYDAVAGRIVSFGGGSTVKGSWTRDTWEFDGAVWTQITSTGPAGRVFHRLAYDSHRGVIVLYGGTDFPGSTHYNDTWEWDGIQWTQADVAGPTGPRVLHAMGYDPKRRKMVLFGGSPGVHNGYLNETWEYGLPPLQLTGLERQGDGSLEIRWTGEAPPYQLQSSASLSAGGWQNEGAPTDTSSATMQTDGAAKFFRVLGLFGNAP